MTILDHANINVPSIDRASRFLKAALPDFVARCGGYLHGDPNLGRWLHIGNDQGYIALQEYADQTGQAHAPYTRVGVNHLGFAVADVDALIARLAKAGYAPSDDSSLDTHPARRRVYFLDPDGLEWEFIEYLTDDPARRHATDDAGPWTAR